ncbi:Tetratricopeptide repeat-containing protein [Tenacibaculum sp. MAR_2009_124]|uniref:tetratricopeptide repeat protein n=1 Tax=Tenacibaculum sp. MAR_2009_124 TaxID=1250059 RepID=UPI0008959515|nr:tetratricopeptide repeat protein [Tenacibaculum sp. MAR_2009_124]SEC43294.1 Tetratricopeptide repeat-containing protein [Tenacibaculum sp. MAR_2009_124]
MRKILFILCIFFFFNVSAQEQKRISALQWREDLRFLQKTVNNDFSFLFKKTTAKEFNTAVEKLHNEIPDLQEHEIIVGFSRIVSLFKYGHTYVSYNQKSFKFSQFPFNLYEFNDGIYIQGTHKNYSKAVGAKVIEVEGMPISEVLDIIEPTVAVENSQFFKAYGINDMRYPEVLHAQKITKKLQNSITLTLEKNGDTFQQKFTVLSNKKRVPTTYGYVQHKNDWLSARNQDRTPLYLKDLDKMYFYEYLSKQKTVYVRHSRVRNDESESIEAFYKRVFDFIEENDVEKLILDVRLNGGGNNYLVKPIITGIIENKKINQKEKLFIIIGRDTFSACQNLVNRLDTYTNAIFVGEATSENVNFYGDASPVYLPNSKMKVLLSFAWWQDKAPWSNDAWLTPQLSVDMSFDEYKNNEDPVLRAVHTFNSEGFILRPMEHIRTLFSKGDMETLQKDIAKMMQDSRYKYFDFERKFIDAGKLLLNQGQYQQAIGVLYSVTQMFPNSAKAWKYLGDCYSRIGKITEAQEFYKKAESIK